MFGGDQTGFLVALLVVFLLLGGATAAAIGTYLHMKQK